MINSMKTGLAQSKLLMVRNADNKLKEKHKNHQKTLRWLIKKIKSQHYAKKFENSQGDKKKTRKIMNELRGKQKLNVKASFVIGNERIICRRIIAEKFNNHFVSLASNLNYATYNETSITSFPHLNPTCPIVVNLQYLWKIAMSKKFWA